MSVNDPLMSIRRSSWNRGSEFERVRGSEQLFSEVVDYVIRYMIKIFDMEVNTNE